ncbi:MAG: hypothetical protein AYK18_17655 [Theionarchaea archaeon DG-70]|nr:MAG: hypothetical protein AYK18_17655 [Theionarchaea archaeon DG-70]
MIVTRRVKQTVKFHAAVKYYPRYGVTTIVTGTVTHGTAHDSPLFKHLIRRIYGPAPIFSDAGYDSEENRLLRNKHLYVREQAVTYFITIGVKDPKV